MRWVFLLQKREGDAIARLDKPAIYHSWMTLSHAVI